jgi:hypothetical protein
MNNKDKNSYSKIGRNIYQTSSSTYRVRVMISGKRVSKNFKTKKEAKLFWQQNIYFNE